MFFEFRSRADREGDVADEAALDPGLEGLVHAELVPVGDVDLLRAARGRAVRRVVRVRHQDVDVQEVAAEGVAVRGGELDDVLDDVVVDRRVVDVVAVAVADEHVGPVGGGSRGGAREEEERGRGEEEAAEVLHHASLLAEACLVSAAAVSAALQVVEEGVQGDGDDGAEEDAAVEERAQGLRHLAEELVGDERDHPEADREGDDVEVQAVLRKSTPPRIRIPVAQTMPNMTIPAPPRTNWGTEATMTASFGTRPRASRMTPPRARDPAALHARHADEADVLGEGGVGEGVEDAADQGAEAVDAQAVGEVALVDLLADDVADARGTCRATRS